MMIQYLYVKQHNKTFLKYLGKTFTNPEIYPGSGKYWKRHLKVHGDDVATYIIGTYETKEELKEAGIYYSKVWNVVESDEWANLKEENGDGGGIKGTLLGENNPAKRLDVRKKISQANKGRKHPELAKRNKTFEMRETVRKTGKANKNRVPWNKGVPCSYITKQKISESKRKRS